MNIGRPLHVICLVIVAGCLHTPQRQPPYILGVPMAEAAPGTVYIRHALKSADDGNTYTIRWSSQTNWPGLTPEWPVARFHIDLAVDGSNYTRRIAYGVQTDKARLAGEFVWSPPLDYSLLSECARIRAAGLDGQPFPVDVGYPPARPIGGYITSAPFVLAGIDCVAPAAGGVVYHNAPMTVTWRQAGAGVSISIYWITPETVSTWSSQILATYTNAVCGTNTFTCNAAMPEAVAARLVLVSNADPLIIGYSQTFIVEP